MNTQFKHALGLEARDKVTGFTGIIAVRCEHLFGCNTYGLVPKVDSSTGKRNETEWFDEGRIEIIGDGVKPESVQVDTPGSLSREHPTGC